MPIIKSAKKRVRQTKRATVRNARTKKTLRVALKNFARSIGSGKSTDSHAKAQSAIAKASKKGILHKNKAARKQRQLAAAAKKAGVKPSASAKKTAKPAAKKSSAKSAPKKTAAKSAPKKSAAKKPVAKKSAAKKK
jgi:small subunit ribosomal protein S20